MWFGVCDIKTGALLAELPLTISGELQRVMQQINTGSFTLPVNDRRCPNDWEALTVPYRVWVIVCDDENNILWGGIIESRQRSTKDTLIGLACVSPEDYLDRRFVLDKRFDQVDQTDIVKWMIGQVNVMGLPFVVDGEASGIRRDREYHADDAASVYQRLSELSNVINGPEWHVSLEWVDDKRSAVVPVVHVGAPRIGRASDTPQAVFELPGGLIEASLEERFKVGEFATHVVTLGGGEGEDRPMSSPQMAVAKENAGWPRCEVRKTYDSVVNKPVLDSHAQSLLASLKDGVRVYSLTQLTDAYPRLGVDWSMGDDVLVDIRTQTLTVKQKLRIVGWSISSDGLLITPHVAQIGGGERP